MRTRKTAVTVLGAALLLGLPALLLAAGAPQSAVPSSREIIRGIYGHQPTPLEEFFKNWVAQYVAAGGDSRTEVTLGWGRAMSTEVSRGQGRVQLNMLSGAVSAEVKDLEGAATDLWLVEFQPDTPAMPKKGDRFVRLGALVDRGDGIGRLTSNLGADFFRTFTLDMAVVSRAGMTPDRSILLLGSRTYFERLFTRARLAVEKQQPGLRDATSDLTPFVSSGLVSQQVADGADLFFRGTFSGNGRTCATCHRVNDNLTLDPPFIDTLPGNDPLFIAELPASLGGVPGLEIPQLQRTFALILENVDGFQNPGVMRGVPHALSLATSIKAPNDGRAPVQRTGWSGDGAPGNGALINFATGAVIQHFTKSLNRVSGTDFVLPTTTQLEQINAFLLATGRLNEIDLANATLTDSGAQAGRGLFLSVGCNNCHKDAGSNIAGGTNNNFNTGIETVPHPGRAIDSVDFPADGGFGTTPNPKGGFGDGTFNVPPLIEAASTPPFFHNNVFNTIEQAVAFYTGPNFAAAPDGFPIALDGAQIFQVAAFLRVINASFSSAISLQRVNAALSLENSSSATFGTASALQTVNALLNLALATDDAAVNVLSTRLLNQGSVNEIDTASTDVQNAIASTDHTTRVSLMQDAITNLTNARTGLGTGLNFTLGEGNLLQ